MKLRRILCVGNLLCHDDGVALVIAQRLREARVPAEVIEAGEFGLSCLDAFQGAEQVIVVDAVSTGAPPGTCALYSDLSFIPSSTCSVGHAISLASMLELVRTLGERVPRVSVIGIEAACLSPFGTRLSDAVEAAIPAAIELVEGELRAGLG